VGRRREPQYALGRAVREARLDRGLTQEQLAERIDADPTWLSRLEAGGNPAWGTVRRIAAALDVSVSELAARAERIEQAAEGSGR
jgi:putative transcriptional regulator